MKIFLIQIQRGEISFGDYGQLFEEYNLVLFFL